MEHHKVTLRKDEGVVVVESGRGCSDQVEQAIAAGRYMRAVLDVIG